MGRHTRGITNDWATRRADLKPDEGQHEGQQEGQHGSSGIRLALFQLLLSPHVQSLEVLKAWAVSAVVVPTTVLTALWGTYAALPILVDTTKWCFTCKTT